MPTLILMRHAKSSWTTGEADHRRPLSGRGVRDATAAGALLADFPIDRVLSSSSTRTRQTWARAEAGGARCSDVTFTDELYGAWTDTVIDLLRELDGSVGTALVLGHEPTMSSVIEVLAEPSELADEAAGRFVTSAVAILDVPGPWSGLSDGGARVVRFEVPRG